MKLPTLASLALVFSLSSLCAQGVPGVPNPEIPGAPVDPAENPGSETAANPSTTPDSSAQGQEPKGAPELSLLLDAPRNTVAWIRIQGVKELATRLVEQRSAKILAALAGTPSTIEGQLADLITGLQSFARQSGIEARALFEILGKDSEIALFPVTSGQYGFLVASVLEDWEGTLRPILEPKRSKAPDWAPEADKASFYALALPFGLPGKLQILIANGKLYIADAQERFEACLSKGKTPSLEGNEEFRSALRAHGLLEAGPGTWLRLYVQPRAALKTVMSTKGKSTTGNGDSSSWLLSAGLPAVQSIVASSRFVDGRFEDRMSLTLEDATRIPFDFLGEGGVTQHLAKYVPSNAKRWSAWRIDSAGLLRFLKRAGFRMPAIGSATEFLAKLESEGLIEDEADCASLIGDELLFVAQNAMHSSSGLVLKLSDSFRVASILDRFAKKGESRGETRYYSWEGKGRDLHLAIRGDDLIVSDKSKGLERLLAGEEELAPAVKDSFATHAGRAQLVGHEDPGYWLGVFDWDRKTGLGNLALEFNRLAFHGTLEGQVLILDGSSEAAPTALTLMGLAECMPRLLHYRMEGNEKAALAFAKRIVEAQRSFLTLREKDKDLAGLPGTMQDLTHEKLLGDPPPKLLDNDVLVNGDYRFRLLLDPKLEPGMEAKFLIVAWPSKPGSTGRKSFALAEDGQVLEHAWLVDLDVKTGPSVAQLFDGEAFTSSFRAGWTAKVTATASALATANKEVKTHSLELPVDKALPLLESANSKKDCDRIRSFLAHSDSKVATRAAELLGKLRDRNSVPDLAKLLNTSQDRAVRSMATKALAAIGDPRADTTLVAALADKDGRVRLFAALGLSKSQAPGVRDALLGLVDRFAEDQDGDRTQAVLTLADRGRADCLIALARTKKGSPRFAQALTWAFQSLSPKLERDEELGVLLAALDSPNARLRQYAIERLAVGEFTEAIPELTEHLAKEEGPLKERTSQALDSLRPDEGIDFAAIWEKAQAKGKTAWQAIRKQPKHIQAIAAAIPALAFLMLLFYFRAKRKRRRKVNQSEVMEFLKPSEEFLAGEEAEASPPMPDLDTMPSTLPEEKRDEALR